MRILQLGKYFFPDKGGIESITESFHKELNLRFITCTTLVFSKEGKKVQNLRFRSGLVIKCREIINLFSSPISIRYFFILKKIVKKHDVIIVHLPNPLVVLFLVMVNPPQKIYVYWHSDIVSQKFLKYGYIFIEKVFLKRVNKIFVSTIEYGKWSKELQNFSDKLHALPLSIDASKYAVNISRYKKLKEQKKDLFYILSVGRLIPYKGFDVLLKAIPLLPKDVRLIIIGNGPLLPKLEKIISELSLQSQVEIFSNIEIGDLSTYYALVDIFCLPSITRAEAYGLVQVEAMLFGKPIVSTSIPGSGVSIVNRHQDTGLICSPNNIDSLAKALNRIYEDKSLRLRLGEAASIKYFDSYTNYKMISQLLKYLEYEPLL